MDNNKKNKILIISVIVAFLSPVILSWWFLNYTDVVTEGGKSNNGDLILPPRQIDNLDLYDPVADKDYELYGKWNMVYVAGICEENCINNIYRMRQIHIAMDKHSLRVQRVLLLTENNQQDLSALFTEYAGQRVVQINSDDANNLLPKFKITETDTPLSENRIYIIDPLGNLMMRYQPDVNPRGIMKDLKKLLKNSRIG